MKVVKLLVALLFSGALFQHLCAQHSQDLPGSDKKLFSFGVIADPQYADAEPQGSRHYRNSLQKLKNCVDGLNDHDLSFTIQLGDLIDRDYSNFDSILPILKTLNEPVYHVTGNHDFSVDEKYRKKVRERLNTGRGYYSWQVGDFVFIVLDGTDVSSFGTTKDIRQYRLTRKNAALSEPDAYPWNGSIGTRQLKWLEKNLKKADRNLQKVLLFCHYPLLSDEVHQLKNSNQVLSLVNGYECVVAWISGHNHAGGYRKPGQIHHLTLEGMVETRWDTSFGIMDVFPDKLVLKGYGRQDDRIMEF